MASDRMRRRIASEAARLISLREESEYFQAKLTAAGRLCPGVVRPDDLPTDREVREHVRAFVNDPTASEWEICAEDSGDQETREGGTANAHRDPRVSDRFEVFEVLLLSLEAVMQDPKRHPEGDALYHSLQVFQHAYDARPYDEDFLLAALLHDVGKAIDRKSHIAAGLSLLDGLISERTAWLIEHQSKAAALRDHKIGARSRRRLTASEDFDDLMLLAQCDREGRQRGVVVPEPAEALRAIRELNEVYG